MSHDPHADDANKREPDDETPPLPPEDDDESLITGELDDETDEADVQEFRDQLEHEPDAAHEADGVASVEAEFDAFAGMAAATAGDAPRRTYKAPTKQQSSLKATAVPLLATVGALLLWPAMWSLMHLAGHQTEAGTRASADGMAKAMLIAWPIAFMLLGSALFLFIQVQKEKAQHRAKLREAEEAKSEGGAASQTNPPKR